MFFIKALNIHPSEIFDVVVSWCLGMLLRLSFVIGWTILLVDFVEHFGVGVLPYLFLIYSLATILGYLIYKQIIPRYKSHMILLTTCILASISSIAAYFLYGIDYNLYLTCLFVTVAIFTNQARVCKMLFVESLFSPLQSTRVFPIIESADTFGLLFGGFAVTLISSYLEIHMLPLFIGISLLSAVPLISVFTWKSIKHPLTVLFHKTNSENSISLKHLSSSTLLMSITAIVFMQFVFFGVLEFQYVSEVFDFSHSGENKDAASFAFDLGFLHIVFGAITMFFQLFMASRLIEFTGIIKSMLISPLVLMSSMIFAIASPGFLPIVLTKFNFELSGVLFNNSYHSAYYVFSHNSRGKIMEFLETLIKPLSMIFISVVMIIFNYLNVDLLYLSLLSLVSLGIMIYSIKLFDKSYAFVPKLHIRSSNDVQNILNSISILRQNPRDNNANFLLRMVASRDFKPEIYPYIFEVISEQGDISSLNMLLDLIKENKIELKYLLPCLNKLFVKFNEEIKDLSFTRYFVHEIFDSIPKDTTDPIIKAESLCFLILTNLSQSFSKQDIIHIRRNLNDSNIDYIYPLLDQIQDSNICLVLKPLISKNNPRLSYFIVRLCSKFNFNLNLNQVSEQMNHNLVTRQYLALMDATTNYNFEINLDDCNSMLCHLCRKLKGLENQFVTLLFWENDVQKIIDLKNITNNILSGSEIKLVNNRLQQVIHSLFEEFDLSDVNCDSNKSLYAKLSEIYNVLGASKEYFLVRDLLSES